METNPVQSNSSDPDQQAYERLAQLPPSQYDRVRRQEARLLRIRVETLDAQVAECRSELDLQS
jgi:hypothetical protein